MDQSQTLNICVIQTELSKLAQTGQAGQSGVGNRGAVQVQVGCDERADSGDRRRLSGAYAPASDGNQNAASKRMRNLAMQLLLNGRT